MYAKFWNLLPGPWPVRAVIVMVLIAAAAFVSFEWVYPALAPYLPLSGATPAQEQGVG